MPATKDMVKVIGLLRRYVLDLVVAEPTRSDVPSMGLAAGGFTPFPTSPVDTAAFLQKETERWTRVVRQTGARAE